MPQWIIKLKKVYTYNNLDQLIGVETKNFGYSKTDTTILKYNDKGKLVECNSNSDWDYKFTYSEEGKFLQGQAIANDLVVLSLRNEWNADGNLVKEIHEEFLYGSVYSVEYLYNSAGELTGNSSGTINYSEWDYSALNVPQVLSLYLLKLPDREKINLPPFSMFTYIDYVEETERYPQKLAGEKTIFRDEGNVVQKTSYYYSDAVTGSSHIEAENISLYPNPAREQVTITWGGKYERLNLKLYHVTGACVLEREFSSGAIISLGNLQKGIYIYRLSDENHPVRSGKLVIQ